MESTLKPEILYRLKKIESAVQRLITQNELPLYPEVDWKGAMGIRDIIAHHYFDIDGDTVLDVIQSDLPPLLETLGRMQEDIVADKI